MKKRNKIFLLTIAFFLFTNIAFASSVWFNSPTNGSTDIGGTINLQYNKTTIYSVYKVKMTDHNNNIYYSNSDDGIPEWWYLPAGTYTWTLDLYEYIPGQGDWHSATKTITFYVFKDKIEISNNINSGIINVDGNERSNGFTLFKSVGASIAVGAIDQPFSDGYNYVWNSSGTNDSKWSRKSENGPSFVELDGSNTRNYNYSVQSDDNGASIQAGLRKVCNLTFTNSFNGISTTGSIKVNGTTVSAPTAQYQVIDQNTIQVEAIQQTYNNIKYTFSHWSDDNSTTNPRTITANSHASISAVFIGTPIFTNYYDNNRNLHTNTYNPRFPNQPITLYWYQHESSNVTSYRIRRGANINGTTTWGIIATVSGSTTSYTDSDFLIASSATGSRVDYDVLAYYSPDQTYSNNEAIQVYGISTEAQKIANTDSTLTELPAINEYALNSNYPNPFNPTTQISYQLPENSFVNLVVYNSLGQKVAELVNQHQSVGQYTVKFDASNLPSGVYIYKLQTDNFSDVKKMLLTK